MNAPDAHEPFASQGLTGSGATSGAVPPSLTPIAIDRSAGLPDPTEWMRLRILAEAFGRIQDHRIGLGNLLGLKADGTPQKTGAHIPEALARPMYAAALKAEDEALGPMIDQYRLVVPAAIQEWKKSTWGIGEPSLARLLGASGHPAIATPHHWEGKGKKNRRLVADEAYERSLRQWWAYCGHGDPERKRRVGMTAEEAFALGNPHCKKYTHMLALWTIGCLLPALYDERLAGDDLKPESRAYYEGQRAKCRVKPYTAPEAEEAAADPTISPDQPSAEANASDNSAGRDTSPDHPLRVSTAMQLAGGSGSSPHQPNGVSAARVATADGDTSAGQPTVHPKALDAAADRRYRVMYDQRRALTAATHPEWSDGHSHEDALRIVGKLGILTDIWRAAQ